MARTTQHQLEIRALEIAARLNHVYYSDNRSFQKWAIQTNLRKNLVADLQEAIALQAFVLHSHGLGRWSLGRYSGTGGGIHTYGHGLTRGQLYEALYLMTDVLGDPFFRR